MEAEFRPEIEKLYSKMANFQRQSLSKSNGDKTTTIRNLLHLLNDIKYIDTNAESLTVSKFIGIFADMLPPVSEADAINLEFELVPYELFVGLFRCIEVKERHRMNNDIKAALTPEISITKEATSDDLSLPRLEIVEASPKESLVVPEKLEKEKEKEKDLKEVKDKELKETQEKLKEKEREKDKGEKEKDRDTSHLQGPRHNNHASESSQHSKSKQQSRDSKDQSKDRETKDTADNKLKDRDRDLKETKELKEAKEKELNEAKEKESRDRDSKDEVLIDHERKDELSADSSNPEMVSSEIDASTTESLKSEPIKPLQERVREAFILILSMAESNLKK
ncbi:hypothetical protein HDU67_005158 [Dinochytrium kinnereticum]|nr:hypothetical protein HDU67_005158 [Dinochytrium kinnereticum]